MGDSSANPTSWIHGDESARAMFARILHQRPFVLLPPLHRLPLRVGNVVEIAGPSPSAKTQVLLQAAVHCILPKEWKGIQFGGLERIVLFFDLDCRFDVRRLSQMLKHRIARVLEFTTKTCKVNEDSKHSSADVATVPWYDDELFSTCMRRFLYTRCYDSFEFVTALKSTHSFAQKESEALGVGIHFLMIDSIGAFYWSDKACLLSPGGDLKRKNLSFHSLTETIVREMRMLLLVQPVLVLATKASIFGPVTSAFDSDRASEKWSSENKNNVRTTGEKDRSFHREYMPSLWQEFVTHRLHLQISGTNSNETNYISPVYTSEWVQPPLNVKDAFSVDDDGIHLIT